MNLSLHEEGQELPPELPPEIIAEIFKYAPKYSQLINKEIAEITAKDYYLSYGNLPITDLDFKEFHRSPI